MPMKKGCIGSDVSNHGDFGALAPSGTPKSPVNSMETVRSAEFWVRRWPPYARTPHRRRVGPEALTRAPKHATHAAPTVFWSLVAMNFPIYLGSQQPSTILLSAESLSPAAE